VITSFLDDLVYTNLYSYLDWQRNAKLFKIVRGDSHNFNFSIQNDHSELGFEKLLNKEQFNGENEYDNG